MKSRNKFGMTQRDSSMLLSLSVRNFILIDQLDLDLSTGLHVITGETGSGKSILLDAILFCLGHNFDTDLIKKGADSCIVSLEIKVPKNLEEYLQENAIEHDGFIIIKRQQSTNNRKKIFINDQIVSQKLVEHISKNLLEIHGQNMQSTLLNVSSHISVIDNYGNLDVFTKEVSDVFKELKALESQLLAIKKERKEVESEIDYLSFVLEELKALDVKEGEEEELASLRIDMQKQEKNIALVKDIYETLTSPAIDSQILSAQKLIHRQDKESAFNDVLENLDKSLFFLDEAIKILDSKIQNIEFNNIDSVEERLFAIRAVARKHNIAADGLPAFYASSLEKLSGLNAKITEESNLSIQIEEVKKKYHSLSVILSAKRKAAALDLEKKIMTELAFLKMENAIFKVDFKHLEMESASSLGLDIVRFIASTNPGTDMEEIQKIASGGELSRFMLAIKVALFDKFTKPTIIFDEVDTGIGGIVADAVGERLRFLSGASQVLVITHQPQVAGKAHNHIFVFKTQEANTTFTKAKLLSDAEKLEEIARMISGHTITSISRKAAEELIK